ncbi:MAG TPA: phosphotransferase [Fimbriimonas sp.]|nr:phosphotransferase [Fimbriimonas sp.]
MTTTAFNSLSQEDQIAGLELLCRAALRTYGIEPTGITSLVHMENTTFKVDSPEGSFNLRISRPGYQSSANVRSEIQWLSALREANFRVPAPYQDRVVRASVPEVPEPRDCVLFRWMDGEFLREWSPEQARKVGRVIAQLHQFSSTWTLPEGFDRQQLHSWASQPEDDHPIYQSSPLVSDEDRAVLIEANRRTREILTTLPRSADRFGLIHSDLHASNVLFEGDQVNVIDFDDSSFAFLYYDFAACLAYQSDDLREPLFQGYEEVLALPPDTRDLMDSFLMVRITGLGKWVLERTDNPSLRESGGSFMTWICKRLRDLS